MWSSIYNKWWFDVLFGDLSEVTKSRHHQINLSA